MAVRTPLLLAILTVSSGCLIPVEQSNGGPDAGAFGGGAGGAGAGAAGGGAGGGTDAGKVDAGSPARFDGGRGYCGGLIDGGWRMTWAGNAISIGSDGGTTSQSQWTSAIWGSSPTDVWAVGAEAVNQKLQGLILHWDGTAWTQVSIGSVLQLYDVWGAGPNDVWAVGLSGTVLHWDGTAWTPTPIGTSRHLNGVWGTGPNNVFIVGGAAPLPPDGALIVRWNGAAWSQVTVAGAWSLASIHGTGPSDIWAVGSTGTLLHFDGTGWTSRAQGAPPRQLLGVLALAPSNAWIAADYGTLLHWDGTVWTPGPFQTTGVMSGVWGQQADDLWSSDGTNCMRWDGASWNRSPWGLDPTGGLGRVWGTGPDDIWAVGSHILHYP